MSNATVSCQCGRVLQVRPDQVGRRVGCPICGHIVNVPNRSIQATGDRVVEVVPQAEEFNSTVIATAEHSRVPKADNQQPVAGRSLAVWIAAGVLNASISGLVLGLAMFSGLIRINHQQPSTDELTPPLSSASSPRPSMAPPRSDTIAVDPQPVASNPTTSVKVTDKQNSPPQFPGPALAPIPLK